MRYRLVGHAEARIDAVLLDSARRWGVSAAARYHRLILAAADAAEEAPDRPGSRPVEQVPGVRTVHLRGARDRVDPADSVAEPRHLLVYRVAPDGVVEILSIVHDRMLLPRAVRTAQRAAERDPQP